MRQPMSTRNRAYVAAKTGLMCSRALRSGSGRRWFLHVRTLRRLRIVAVVTALSCAFAIALASPTPSAIATGVLSGIGIACPLALLEILLNSRLADLVHRLPVVVTFLIRTGLYGLAFVLVPPVASGLIRWKWPSADGFANINLVPSFAFAFGINLVLMFARLLGPRILISLLTGRYHQPREEQRIVLFLDVKESTRLAERLGDKQFHRFLNRVFFDVSDPVAAAGGEIYRYVGDEIIVTWSIAHGVRQAACLSCVFDIEDALAARRTQYLAEFGVQPQLRAAIHAGALIIGEMGDWKREVVMLGDTMNTTARIEDVCRARHCDYIVSAAVLDRVASLPPGVRVQSLGLVELPGKKVGISLFALSRMAVGETSCDTTTSLIASLSDDIAHATPRPRVAPK